MSGTNYDGEDPHGNRDFEKTTQGKRAMDEILHAAPTDSEVFPEVTMSYKGEDLDDIPLEYTVGEQSTRNLYEGIKSDWETNSPISPAPHMYGILDKEDSTELFKTMMEITRIRNRLGRKVSKIVSKIDNARTAAELFKSVRAEVRVHPNDLFDSDWLDINPESTQSSGLDQIMKGYPYARYRLNLDMSDGLDQHQRLISFTQGDMTIFADDNNYFAQNSNIFWYQDGFLQYGATIGTSKQGVLDNDVFVFSDEQKIHETGFHKVNSAFYKALSEQGRHFETDMTMQHLRTLYEDNDAQELGARLKDALSVTSVGLDSVSERLCLNKLVTETIDDYVKAQDRKLITDEDFEEYIERGLSEIQIKKNNLMKRGSVPLNKLSRD